jgi:hypothetical protein
MLTPLDGGREVSDSHAPFLVSHVGVCPRPAVCQYKLSPGDSGGPLTMGAHTGERTESFLYVCDRVPPPKSLNSTVSIVSAVNNMVETETTPIPTLKEFVDYLRNALTGLGADCDEDIGRASRDIWDFITALRGPDWWDVKGRLQHWETSDLKENTAGILRALVIDSDDFCVVNRTEDKDAAKDAALRLVRARGELSIGSFYSEHYMTHFRSAVEALKRNGLWESE